jgi:hypothetical protein
MLWFDSIWILALAVYSGIGCHICARTKLKKTQEEGRENHDPLAAT